MNNRIIFSGGRIVDPRKDSLGPVVHVRVEDGIIREVSEAPLSHADARVFDIGGLTLMPGLIDAHVHLFMNEMNISALANVPQTYATAKAVMVAKGMLRRGFTTVRDVAGGDYGIRDAVDAGFIESPRLFIGGKAISQTGGHGDFRRRTDSEYDCACCTGLSLFSLMADGVPEVIKATREQLRLGANHIKIMLSGGVASPNDPIDSIQYRVDEIAACVEEAQRWGVYVCAHAYSDEAVRRAVVNGVRTIEHGNLAKPETAKLMAETGVFVVPTLITHEVTHKLGAASGKSPDSLEKNERVRKAGIAALKMYHTAGTSIGYGTDLSMHTQQYQNQGLAIHAGMLGAAEAIRSATIVNAQIVQQDGRLGEIIPGAHADLLVLDGDPFKDINVLCEHESNILAVMKGGVFYKETDRVRLQ